MPLSLREASADRQPCGPAEGNDATQDDLDPMLTRLADLLLRTTPQAAVTIRDAVRGFTRAERTLLQFRVLHRLRDGPCTTSDLAGVHGASAPAISKVVGMLAEDGLIARRHDPRDRRYVRLALTPAGRDHVRAMMGVARRGIAERLVGLSEAERATLLAGLELLGRCLDPGRAVAQAVAADASGAASACGGTS